MSALSNGSAQGSVPSTTRVVYVVESPFTPRDAQRFGLASMEAAGFAVVVWEVAPIFLPRSETGDAERAQGVEIHRMAAISDLLEAVRHLRDTDLVMLLCGTQRRQLRRHRALHAALGPTPARLATAVAGQIPALTPARLRWCTTRAEARSHMWRLRQAAVEAPPVTALVRKWNSLRHRIRPLDFAWVGTTSTSLEPTLLARRTCIRPIHAFDYDLVLALEPGLDPSAWGVVLLDSMGPLHPDYTSLGLEANRPTNDNYFGVIRAFLDGFERATGSRVRIAAHPRAAPGSLEPWYGGRTIVYGNTVRCIAQSTLVILPNNSTAANLVVALNKPCLFLTSTNFDPILEPYVRNLSVLLNAPVQDAGLPVSAAFDTSVDQIAYGRFMADFVKRPGTPMSPFWDVVGQDIRDADIIEP